MEVLKICNDMNIYITICIYINRNQASQKEAQNRLDENEQLINELISEKEALKQKIEIMSEQMEFAGIYIYWILININ